MEKGSSVRSQLTGRRYRVGELLGHGGYGKAFEAEDVGNHALVCLKYTFDQLSWHREAYFGELLRGQDRVLQIYDSFPLVPTGGMGRVRYCLAIELADHGAVADHLAKTKTPWPEAKAKREVLGLLEVLDLLHGGSATHRDITPFNVFVCDKGRLKLGDFGVARHELGGRPIKPDSFNPDFVTRGFLDSRHRAWRGADDVYQMGQLLALLLAGRAEPRVRRAELRKIPMSDATRAVLHRAIGPRAQRYADAWEMRAALRGAPLLSRTPLTSLRGRCVAFVGTLTVSRFDAELLVVRAGGRVASAITREVDVVIVGKGARGAKLAAAERLRREGHPIRLLDEDTLRRLARA